MKLLLATAAALWLAAGVAIACDDHIGLCEVEDWRYYHTEAMRMLGIEGTATCNEGELTLRAYSGTEDDPNLVGVDTTYIEGHVFKTAIFAVHARPENLFIKYSIDPSQ